MLSLWTLPLSSVWKLIMHNCNLFRGQSFSFVLVSDCLILTSFSFLPPLLSLSATAWKRSASTLPSSENSPTWYSSLLTSSQSPASRYFLILPSTTWPFLPWMTRWSRKARAASLATSRASLASAAKLNPVVLHSPQESHTRPQPGLGQLLVRTILCLSCSF